MLVTGLFNVIQIFILFIVASAWPRSNNLVKVHTPEQLEGQRGMKTYSLLGQEISRKAAGTVETLLGVLQKDAQGHLPQPSDSCSFRASSSQKFHWLPWLLVHRSLLVSSTENTAWNSGTARSFFIVFWKSLLLWIWEILWKTKCKSAV